MITIGEILKPKGIKGALKIRPLTDDVRRFEYLQAVYIGGVSYPIQSVSFEGGFVVISLCGVADRNAAELLRGRMLEIEAADAVALEEGSYFISDIIGCTLTDEKDKKLGQITAVDSFGAADVITAKKGDKELRFPFLERIVVKVDVAAKIFQVNRKLWKEVTVFDD